MIKDNYDDYDSFIIIHGTDTLAYSASAISFMCENLSKPVIFTAAQIPISEWRNDAYGNLLQAMTVSAY